MCVGAGLEEKTMILLCSFSNRGNKKGGKCANLQKILPHYFLFLLDEWIQSTLIGETRKQHQSNFCCKAGTELMF